MIKRVLTVIILLLSTSLFAAQRIAVKEGIETSIPISQRGLNHIAVENDRILMVKGSQAPFQLDKDEVLGQLYLQPEPNITSPIHLFLTTENQRTLSLLLEPKDIPQESITLVLEEKDKTVSFEHSKPYELEVVNLIKAMASQTSLEGYAIEDVNLKNKGPKGLKVLHLLSYRGEVLRGEVVEITNPGKETIPLDEKDFYKPSVRAVALSSHAAAPGEKITLYLVRIHG